MKVSIFNQYAEEVCRVFNVSKKGLFTKSKKRDVVDARHMLYYLCYNRPMRLVRIQEYMADNGYLISHNSIIHGINVVKDRLAHDRDYVRTLEKIAEYEL